MPNWTKEEFTKMMKMNPDLEVQLGLFGGGRQMGRTKAAQIQKEVQEEFPISGPELFHRLAKHREKHKLETGYHGVQATYVEWIRLNKLYAEPLRSFFSVPNGGKRAKKTAKVMKAEGLEAGVPDTMILSPARGYAGLVIEFKTKYDQPRENQIEWLNRLARNNFYCVAAWSTLDAVNVTCWFYDLSDEVRHRWPL